MLPYSSPVTCIDLFSLGWLCATSWQTSLASASFFAGITIQGLITLNNASYVGKGWHGTLLTIAVALVAILFNTVLAKRAALSRGCARCFASTRRLHPSPSLGPVPH